jgi:tRNA dimethylallyltransferase
MKQQIIILIGGPTASGKSAFAMKLARQKYGSIINADAMQIYASLPLLTAQPDASDKTEIPHLLYEVTDPSEPSSAGKWLSQARDAITQTCKAGRTPILVGGTGLYFEALQGGLADIPNIPEEVRAEVQKLYDAWGEEKFRGALSEFDKESALRIARNDRQRLIRAYEVAIHTGKNLGFWQQQKSPPPLQDAQEEFTFEHHLLLPPRDNLYEACDKRFLQMIEHGAIDEVKNLLARKLSPELPAMKILGVRELASYLNGEASLESAILKAQQMTRNYAKRQLTWFRNKWAHIPLA